MPIKPHPAFLLAALLALAVLTACRTGRAQEPTPTPVDPTPVAATAAPTPTTSPTPTPPPRATPTPVPTLTPTAPAPPTPTPITVVLVELRNDEYDYTIGVPREWDVFGLQSALAQGWSPARESLLYVKLFPFPNPFYNISSYTDLWLDSLRAEAQDFKELSRTPFKLNGLPALEVTYSYTFGGETFRARALFILAGTMAFFVDGIATEKLWPSQEATLSAVVRSFRPGPSYFPPANP